MTMPVTIIDSIDDELFTVEFKDDHFCELVRQSQVFTRPKWIRGEMYKVPMMKHTDLIKAINEMAL